MIRKLFSAILCLMLALTVPLCSLAATEATLTIVPGDEIAKQAIVKETLDTFALRFTGDKEALAGSVGIMMGGESVFDLALRVTPDGLYAQSAVLGDKALCFPWEDVANFVQNLIKQSGVDFSQIVGTFGHMPQMIPVGITSLTDGSANDYEKLLANVKEAFKDDPVIVELIDDLIARIVVTEGEFASEEHDTATKKTELILTSADYVKLVDSNRVRDIIKKIVDQQFASYSDEEKAAELDSTVAMIKKLYSDLNLSVSITMLTAGNSKLPVAMVIDMTTDGFIEVNTTNKDGEKTTRQQPAKLSIPMSYNRLTSESGVHHSVTMTADVNGKTEATMKGYLDSNNDGTGRGVYGILAGGEEINFTYSKIKTGDVKNREISLYYRSGATSLIEPAAADRPLISFRLETKPADEQILAAVKSATPDSSVKLLNMSRDELASYTNDLLTRMTQLLYTVLGKLPPSVIEAMGPLFGN